MSKILITYILSLMTYGSLQAQTLPEVLATAKDSGKNVLIIFSGSDWCIPCIKMEKQVFEKQEFKDYAGSHLAIVHADFPRLKKNQLPKEQQQLNESLAEKYNAKGSFPLTVLTNADGKVLKEWAGYKDDLTAMLFIQQVESAAHATK